MTTNTELGAALTERIDEVRKNLELLAASDVPARIEAAAEVVVDALRAGRPLLVCGNGGSASDALHIAGELVGRFLAERRALNVIPLVANGSALTAWANDYDYHSVFERQVEAHGQPGAVLLGLSTSGNSTNVVRALRRAREMGISTIGLTGAGGGKMAELCDVLLDVPSTSTPRIQELHIVVYHYLCERVEAAFA